MLVCNESIVNLQTWFKEKEEKRKDATESRIKHLHHDHKQENNNIIAYACNRCNLQMTEKRKAGIPVIFHNGSGYNWKFLMKEIGSIIEEELKGMEKEDLTNKQTKEIRKD